MVADQVTVRVRIRRRHARPSAKLFEVHRAKAPLGEGALAEVRVRVRVRVKARVRVRVGIRLGLGLGLGLGLRLRRRLAQSSKTRRCT